MAEWSKALDLGSSHFDGVGSNPTAAKLFLAPPRRLLFASRTAETRELPAGAARGRHGASGAARAGHGALWVLGAVGHSG